jgi:hypothetical protein
VNKTLCWYPSRLADLDFDNRSAYDGQVTGERIRGLLRPRFAREAVEAMASNTPQSPGKTVRLNGSTAEIWSHNLAAEAHLTDRIAPVDGWYHLPGGWQETTTRPSYQFLTWHREITEAGYRPAGDSWTVVFEDRTTHMAVLATFPTPASDQTQGALRVLLLEEDLASYIVPARSGMAAEQAARAYLQASRPPLTTAAITRPARTITVHSPLPGTVIPAPAH